jgi:hypothetical protein
METPQGKAVPGLLSYSYGSPSPLLLNRSQSHGDAQLMSTIDGDAEMHDVLSQMRGMQFEETKDEMMLEQQSFQTPDRKQRTPQNLAGSRLSFQSFVFNQRFRPPHHHDSYFLSSPPLNLRTQDRVRSNSFLVHDAPRLPESLDDSEQGNSRTQNNYLPPPMFSPPYKYSTINTSALLQENVSTNEMALSTFNTCSKSNGPYYHHYTPCQSPHPTTATPSAGCESLHSPPPIMPMIGASPCTPSNRRLVLKMRKGNDLPLVNSIAQRSPLRPCQTSMP